jgi:hypothetical protein
MALATAAILPVPCQRQGRRRNESPAGLAADRPKHRARVSIRAGVQGANGVNSARRAAMPPLRDVPTALRDKTWRRAPRLRLRKLGRLLALCPRLICLRSLTRRRRSDGGAVAREARPAIPCHGNRSLRLRAWPVQVRFPTGWRLSRLISGRRSTPTSTGRPLTAPMPP